MLHESDETVLGEKTVVRLNMDKSSVIVDF